MDAKVLDLCITFYMNVNLRETKSQANSSLSVYARKLTITC